MGRVSLFTVFAREWLGQRTLRREPEPALVMDDAEQVRAYEEAGRIDGVMAAAYLFHTARISQVIAGCDEVLDLGCGPGTQLMQVAQFNQDTRFTGIDLSEPMLDRARAAFESTQVTNVTVRRDDISTLASVPDASVDAVISTMALHHLPSVELLNATFGAIARVLKPNGALYLADFGRLKSLRSVIYFAYRNARHQPHLFSLDYERSLRAAFLRDDLRQATEMYLAGKAKLVSTFKVPFLVAIKSPDRPIGDAMRSELRRRRGQLHPRYRRDLDDLRMFFRFGGLDNDPFSARNDSTAGLPVRPVGGGA